VVGVESDYVSAGVKGMLGTYFESLEEARE